MTEIVLAPADLARIRFAHSPVRELAASLRVLQDPSRQSMYHAWRSAVGRRLRGVRLELLTALAPAAAQRTAGFLLPPASRPWGALAAELAVIAATPPAMVRADLERLYPARRLPAVLGPLYQDPARHLPTVVGELDRYWQAAIAPGWPRIRALSMADVAYRMQRFAAAGIVGVLADLHPQLCLDRDRLRIHRPQHRASVALAGAGIVLAPCGFCWPTLVVECRGAGQALLGYPTRGVAQLWQEPPASRPDPLAALVGRTRATLLAMLRLPRTTTQLADQLALSPAAVSQHLKILKDAGLVTTRRCGRMVLYQHTTAASTLLAAIHPDQAAG